MKTSDCRTIPFARLIIRVAFLYVILLLPQWASGDVGVTININSTIGTETGKHYGVGLWSAMDPAVAANSGYRVGLTNVAPRIVRYHAGEQEVNGDSKCWVDYSSKKWNGAVIKRVLDQRPSSASDILINVASWPGWMDTNNDGKLDANQVDAFANFCANLVDLVNNTYHYNVKYWEPMNEKQDAYRTNIADLADIHRRCVVAMKAKDPSIKIVSGAWNQPWDTANISAFCNAVKGYMDVFSYHGYANGGTLDRSTIYAGADLTSGIQNVRNQLTGQDNVAIWVDEWAIFWVWNATGAYYMAQDVGAVFAGLAIKKAVLQGKAEALDIFNDADNTYGLWDMNGQLRPSGNLFKLLNTYGIGNVIAASTTDNTKIECFSVVNGGKVMIALVNRSLTYQTVNITATGASPQTKYQIGAATTSAALGSFAGISVPADNVVIVIGRVPAPQLRITPTATNTVALTWPSTSTGFLLQDNLSLANTNWHNTTNLALPVPGKNQVIFPCSTSNRYFRLISQ